MDTYLLTPQEFAKFSRLIYEQCGISLADHKRHMVQSRLQKRLRAHGLTRFMDYYELVMAGGATGAEMGALINCITTNKTDFFREPHHFEYVKNRILPQIIAEAKRGLIPRKLRVWHAGCSTGEEPYTLAMVLCEAFANESGWDIRQLASDIDTQVLEHAARGVYEADRLVPVPEDLKRKYFTRQQQNGETVYAASEQLKEYLTFRQINLLADPWPIRDDVRFDLLFCRNVVIYFDKPTQRKLFARYAEKVRLGGHLMIGHSESLLGISDAFEPLGQTIFRLPEGNAAAIPSRRAA